MGTRPRRKRSYTDFLYARPSFLEGAARIVDFFGVLRQYNSSASTKSADSRAMRADWNAVAADLWDVLDTYGSNAELHHAHGG